MQTSNLNDADSMQPSIILLKRSISQGSKKRVETQAFTQEKYNDHYSICLQWQQEVIEACTFNGIS